MSEVLVIDVNEGGEEKDGKEVGRRDLGIKQRGAHYYSSTIPGDAGEGSMSLGGDGNQRAACFFTL